MTTAKNKGKKTMYERTVRFMGGNPGMQVQARNGAGGAIPRGAAPAPQQDQGGFNAAGVGGLLGMMQRRGLGQQKQPGLMERTGDAAQAAVQPQGLMARTGDAAQAAATPQPSGIGNGTPAGAASQAASSVPAPSVSAMMPPQGGAMAAQPSAMPQPQAAPAGTGMAPQGAAPTGFDFAKLQQAMGGLLGGGF